MDGSSSSQTDLLGLLVLGIVLHEEQNDETQRELYFCVPRIYFIVCVDKCTKCTKTKHNCYGYEIREQRNQSYSRIRDCKM